MSLSQTIFVTVKEAKRIIATLEPTKHEDGTAYRLLQLKKAIPHGATGFEWVVGPAEKKAAERYKDELPWFPGRFKA